MMGIWAAYLASGEITRVFTVPVTMTSVIANLRTGESALALEELINADDFYIIDDVLTARTPMVLIPSTLAVAVNAPFTVAGIPVGTHVAYRGGETVVTDGSITWASDEAGIFYFTFTLFPYRKEVLIVSVN